MIFYKELFHKIEKILWSVFLKPFFFSIDPEKVHHFVVGAMKLFSPIFYLRKSFYHFKINGKNHPSLEKEVFGIKFPNPVGLAAGFDKNAEVYKQMSSLGFGFIEIGTVTPVSQDGNPKKRIFRLVNDNALINRLGFNNDGVDKVVGRLRNKGNIIIGGNIGKNKLTPNEKAKDDYLICFKALYDHVDYFAVNVSSPNTPNLRDLQNINDLHEILCPLINENNKRDTKPILIKISPFFNKLGLSKPGLPSKGEWELKSPNTIKDLLFIELIFERTISLSFILKSRSLGLKCTTKKSTPKVSQCNIPCQSPSINFSFTTIGLTDVKPTEWQLSLRITAYLCPHFFASSSKVSSL